MKKIIVIMLLVFGLFSCGATEEEKKISILTKKIEGCKSEKDENGKFCDRIGIIQDFFEKGNFNKILLKKIIDNKIIDNDELIQGVFYYILSKYDKKTKKIDNNIKNILNDILKEKLIQPYLLGTRYAKEKQCYNDEGSIFHIFIIMNDIEELKFLLDNNLLDLKIKYCYQDYPILQILKPEKKESFKIFELLLNYGADPLDENIMGYSTIQRINNQYRFTSNKEEKDNIKKVLNLLRNY